MHGSPTPAYPSYRLVTALRLLHINIANAGVERESMIELQAWRGVTHGRRDVISRENEAAWRATLVGICEGVARRAEGALKELANMVRGETRQGHCKWDDWMMDNMRLLWVEEQEVARAVIESIERGEEF